MRVIEATLGMWLKGGKNYTAVREAGDTRQTIRAQMLADGYTIDTVNMLNRVKQRQAAIIHSQSKTVQVGGVELQSGLIVPTDLEARQIFSDAMRELDADPTYVLEDYKMPDDSFRDLTPAQITLAYTKIRDHVRATLKKERQLVAQIEAATTKEDVRLITW